MVRGDQGLAGAVKFQPVEAQAVVEIDVVEAQQRQQARECPLTLKTRMRTEVVEVRCEHPRGVPRDPFIEVTQHDAGARQFRAVQNALTDHASGLFTAFEISRAQMDIEQVKDLPVLEPHVGAKDAPRFTAARRDVVIPPVDDRESRKEKVAVCRAVVPPVLSKNRMIAQPLRDIARLVCFWVLPRPRTSWSAMMSASISSSTSA